MGKMWIYKFILVFNLCNLWTDMYQSSILELNNINFYEHGINIFNINI